jgi:hypothetical protein
MGKGQDAEKEDEGNKRTGEKGKRLKDEVSTSLSFLTTGSPTLTAVTPFPLYPFPCSPVFLLDSSKT